MSNKLVASYSKKESSLYLAGHMSTYAYKRVIPCTSRQKAFAYKGKCSQ